MWRTVLGKVASLWRGLSGNVKGFILGIPVGLIVLSLFSVTCGSNSKDRIALENLNAALDSTRAIAAKHDTVYARLLAQKDVQLTGALHDVARAQRDRPRAVVTVTGRGSVLDTTARHRFVDAGHGIRRDSLLFTVPPILGRVDVAVTDSEMLWAAHLRPSPVNLTLALTCGPKGPEVLAKGPGWISTSVEGGQVDPTVCHPKPSRWFAGVKTGVAITAGTYVAVKILGSILHK